MVKSIPILSPVEKAIHFLISASKSIFAPPKKTVNTPKTPKKEFRLVPPPQTMKCNIYPATTRVLLWTSALTGVGASIAMGNQNVKGNWALFVREHRDRTNSHTLNRTGLPKKAIHLTIRISIRQSPNRLTKNTFMALSLPTLL